MTIKTVKTFHCNIYVGFKQRETGLHIDGLSVHEAIRKYVDAVGLCVSVTDTEYVYSYGSEPGIIVGLINYPRFPSDPAAIKAHATAIAEMLLKVCKQLKVTIVMPEDTIMLSAEESE